MSWHKDVLKYYTGIETFSLNSSRPTSIADKAYEIWSLHPLQSQVPMPELGNANPFEPYKSYIENIGI